MSSEMTATGERELVFPAGLVGLPALVHHRLVPVEGTPLFEMACTDDPDFGFILARAELVRPGMTADLQGHGVIAESEELFAILSVHGDPAVITANLAGPLAVNAEGKGRQVVLEDDAYDLRTPVQVEEPD